MKLNFLFIWWPRSQERNNSSCSTLVRVKPHHYDPPQWMRSLFFLQRANLYFRGWEVQPETANYFRRVYGFSYRIKDQIGCWSCDCERNCLNGGDCKKKKVDHVGFKFLYTVRFRNHQNEMKKRSSFAESLVHCTQKWAYGTAQTCGMKGWSAHCCYFLQYFEYEGIWKVLLFSGQFVMISTTLTLKKDDKCHE